MKKLISMILFCLLLTGCSQKAEPEEQEVVVSLTPEEDSSLADMIESAFEDYTFPNPVSTDESGGVSTNVYYLTSHGTQDSANLTKFISHLEGDHFIWHETESIPSDADILIINSPQEDLTAEEFKSLESYMNQGGDLLFLLPASESDTRFRYFNFLLEEFYIQIDYDKISETDQSRIQADGSIQLQAINYPDRFYFYNDTMSDGIVYLKNSRSFHMLSEESSLSVFIDAMLETEKSAIGEPCGGEQDDPVTYEQEALPVMLYVRDEAKQNASLIAVGSADFLLDQNFDADTSKAAQYWIYSSLSWFTAYAAY